MRTWLLAIGLALPALAAATIHVPADYPTIQAAINAAGGDSILVAPGTYVENLKAFTSVILVSEGGPAATIIDGSQPSNPDSASVIFAPGGIRLQGFTITGGSGTTRGVGGELKSGGGLYLGYTSTISGNWITENHVPFIGGGIGVFSQNFGTHNIIGNRIYSNSAGENGGAALISVTAALSLTLQENFIYDNHAYNGTGGATHNPGGDHGLHLRNVYACNTAGDPFVGNGAIWGCYEIRSCTFVSNEGTAAAVNPRFGKTHNSIFAFNVGGGLGCPSFATSTCNDFFMNTPFDQGGCAPIGQNGNISVDPGFGDAGSCGASYCLSLTSPLLPENSPPGCDLIGARYLCEVTAIDVATSPDFASGPLLAYPNPLNPQTTLSFVLAESRHVELRIHDAQGRVVRRLVSKEMERGTHEVAWDGRNDRGLEVASGGYIAVLESPAARLSQKLLVLK